jgi:uncharacterized protein YkwD
MQQMPFSPGNNLYGVTVFLRYTKPSTTMKTAVLFGLLVSTLCQLSWSQDKTIMTPREALMIEEINLVRTQPQAYIDTVKNYMEAGYFKPAAKRVAVELIKKLETMTPLKPLSFSTALYETAKKHGEWMAKTGKFNHSQYGMQYRENLVAGVESVREAVLDLLVDYKIAGREHRNTILLGKLKYVAVYEVRGVKVGGVMPAFVQQFH